MSTSSPIPTSSPDVAEFLAKSKIPRARAVKKLEDVLRRVTSGAPEMAPVRELWVFGSFARGAAAVGDIDLHMLVDEQRTFEQFGLDTYYGERPYAAQVKALGCGGSSMVSVQPTPVFAEPREPASPERLAALGRAGAAEVVPTEPPAITHIVTGEPLAGPFHLLWARGDTLEWALTRLHRIPEVPDAGRHERTCTVPLLDDLAPKLGLPTVFTLAAQVRKGNLFIRALVLHPAEAPVQARRKLDARYVRRWELDKPVSPRMLAGAAALHRLVEEGTELRDVVFVDEFITSDRGQREVVVDFNPFQLYLAAAGSYETGSRVMNVWPSGRKGPWLAVEATILDKGRVLDLYRWLTDLNERPEARVSRLLEAISGDPTPIPAGGR